MALYKIEKHQLKQIKSKPFNLEKDLQKLIEANLSLIMGLEFVETEVSIKNKRIDTLAFDKETKSFVIVEYKRDKNSSVIDQGFTYLSLLLENKEAFIYVYYESKKQHLNKSDIDWSQTRMIFIAPSFTDYQKQAINFQDLPIELWEAQKYDDILSILPIRKNDSAASIKPMIEDKYKEISKEIVTYTQEQHLSNIPDGTKELYEKFKNAILNLDDNIRVESTKLYIVFKKENINLCSIVIHKNDIKLFINLEKGVLDDSKKLTRDVSKIGHWAVGDYELSIESDKNLEYIMSLVKQTLVN
ncbi:MAG: DUF5655 domain-containing protein [Elusimicrobiota bacterium]|jgi:predicted transport protein|nr:DUF5655 domain-containing protein [Elusimicrobiota bacterium]